MGTMRRVVFPILRIVIWGIIAIALCVLAFRQTGGALEQPDDGVTAPGADFTDPVVTVERQTVVNAVELTGTIDPVPGTEVKAPDSGTVVYFAMPSGRMVDENEPLMTVRWTEEREPLERVDDEGNTTTVPQSPLVRESTVYANAAGEISFTVELNDEVSAGDVVARIDPGENLAVAPVPPEYLYRLVDLPRRAEITIANGPEPFRCSNLRLETSTDSEGSSATELRCDIPEKVVVFPGLTITVSVTTDTQEGALVVPLTAVRGTYESGSVWVVGADGEPVETPVALGINDGKVVQVTEGVEEGDTVLQFVPGASAEYQDPDEAVDGDGEGVEEESAVEEGEGTVDDGSGEESVDDGGEG